MNVFRILRRVGTIVLVAALIVVAVDSKARPGITGLIFSLLLAVAAGVISGFVLRQAVPLRLRLKVIHSLSPRLAKRLLPPADRTHDDGD